MANNKIFKENCEEVFPLTIKMGDREIRRQVGFRWICGSTWGGHLLKSNKLMGKWIWNKSRFSQPVFFSALVVGKNGRPARITHSPLIEALADLVNVLTRCDQQMFHNQKVREAMAFQVKAMVDATIAAEAAPQQEEEVASPAKEAAEAV